MQNEVRYLIDPAERRTTYAAGSNETNFLSRNSGTSHCRGMTDVLMVTTTMRMVNGVHSNTTSTGPAGPTLVNLVEEME